VLVVLIGVPREAIRLVYLVHDVGRKADGVEGLKGIRSRFAQNDQVVLLAVLCHRQKARPDGTASAGHVSAIAVKSTVVAATSTAAAVVTTAAVAALKIKK
jgi:hypothetical protein